MRDEIVKVQFTCEGTFRKGDELLYCQRQIVIEGPASETTREYKAAGWGWIDSYGIRHLCNNHHIEKRITTRIVGI